MEYVFVYGSLKSGLHNHRVLGDSLYVMSTHTKEKFLMISLGTFPAVILDEPEYKIAGEVYEVNDKILRNLDHLEGNNKFYKRKLVRVDGMKAKVWVYFIMYPEEYNYDNDEGVFIHGDKQYWKHK